MSDVVVEAMARGMWAEFHKTKPERFAVACPNPQRWRDLALAAIRACRDAGGLVVGEMPRDAPQPASATGYAAGVLGGYNTALREVRAAAVEVE